MIKFDQTINQQEFVVSTPTSYFQQSIDLNGDGYDDLVIAGALYPGGGFETGPQPGYFLINDKEGGFVIAGGDAPYSYHPRSTVVADFNGDGLNDIFIADHGYDVDPFPGYTNHLLLNTGNNSYVDASDRLPQFWDFTHSAAAGDIDGNGSMDLYIGNVYGGEEINPYFLINDGSAHFTVDVARVPDSLETGVSQHAKQALSATFLDVNHDGHLDLILGSNGGDGVSSVFYNDGAGNFSDDRKMDLPKNNQGGGAFTLVHDIKAADLNGDGLADLVVLSATQAFYGWSIQILMGQADGSFADESAARMGSYPTYNVSDSVSGFLTLRDVSDDGTIDVIVNGGGDIDSAPAVMFNDDSGFFSVLSEQQLAAETPYFEGWAQEMLTTPDGLQVVNVFGNEGTIYVESVAELLGGGNWTEIGTSAKDTFSGTSDDDRILGRSGDDLFRASDGSDVFDGGGGFDIVRYSGSRDDFEVRLSSNGTITVVKPSGSDTLTGIERVAFSDGALVYDLDGANGPAAYRLYGGAFDRTPDDGGLMFWADYLGNGGTLLQAATGFIASAEFTALYGSNLSDADFVDQLYLNVLGRPGEDAGVQFWSGYLADGGDRAAALVDFTQLPEYVGLSHADINNGYWVVPS
ncbi:FG-GAP-like repeat-containing protein [Mesorhizobium sp. CAU 1741]|uniref:FG-GAP-like repeat-containing protein n=1 Tax=Mesorhizobium sp. CAU 1741 TaxID=3140366 RepID=UPI00325B0555